MTASNSPARDVKFITETPDISASSSDMPQEQLHLSKKPRNYKYWSDEEVKKILDWLTLPENEGKLTRNKAQACREVAKKLFDGDEYMAISVRSKLMSLEKNYKEGEQLRLQLNSCTKDEAIIHEKIKEGSKFHKECRLLFGGQKTIEAFAPNTGSPTTPITSVPPSSSSSTNPYSPIQSSINIHTNNDNQKYIPSNLVITSPEYDTHAPYDEPTNSTKSNSFSNTMLPRLHDDRLRSLTNSSTITRTFWTLPPVKSVDLPSVDLLQPHTKSTHKSNNNNMHINTAYSGQQQQPKKKRRKPVSEDSPSNTNTLVAKYAAKQASYAAKQASYAAKQAEFEALKSEHELSKMQYAVRLAEIELDRDVLLVKKLELELQLTRNKERS
ncbi:hypothetical protein BDF20DRAFT_916984 [Mycotypha africana]|uniref:uncharacterized protein n=1 Tax=Mycotypha africana TaxID=64632 RepID=UPI00230196C1|nr:uncharacterized protein BDF20DRAFT_916984 [Mycotypha africana]KAI8968467.1 hypothetical protein BDF20DRAFT_916984 [Mycotypha africana]